MNRRYIKPVTSVTLAFLALIIVLSAGGSRVSAQENEEPAAEFSLVPIDTEGGFFNLTLSPEETRQIQTEIHNSGTADGDAHIYLADVSTRTNGGMAAGLAGELVSGPALWIDFSEEIVPVEAGASFTKTFTISVPDDAAPGQYLTSVVIQDAGDGEDTESESGVMIKTVSRQALGILITIPGPVSSALELGTAEHTTAGDHSVITFQAMNSGNVLLKTTGEFMLADSTGQELFRTLVEYSPIYAGTSTTLEVPVDVMLEPGDYTASLLLEDSASGVRTESGSLKLNVPVPEIPVGANPQNPQNPQSITDPMTGAVIESQTTGIPTWALLVAIPAAVILGALIAVGIVLGLRKRSNASNATQPAIAPQHIVTSEVTQRAPVRKQATVRQMMPPSRRANQSTAQGDLD